MSFDLIFQNAVALHQNGRLDEAENAYRQILEVNPQHADSLHLLGMIAMRRRSFDSAIELLYKAHSLAPDEISYEFTLAQALQESGRPKEALEHYAAVSRQNDSIPELHHNLGIVYRSMNDLVRAKAEFSKAVDLKNDFAPSLVNLAVMEREEGNPENALALLEQAVKADAENAEALFQTAVTLRGMGKYAEASDYHERTLKIDPYSALYWTGAAITYERDDRLDDAKDAYDNAIRCDPSFPDAYNGRANVYVKTGKHWDAEADFKKAVALDPQFAAAYNNLGALLYDCGRIQEALECYRKAFVLNPKQAETSSNLAMAVKEAGDPAEAVGLYLNALALNPKLTRVHHYLAEALYALYRQKDGADMAKLLAGKWARFFPDNAVARHVVQSFDGENPAAADPAYVRDLFDSFSDTFDKTMADIRYRVPDLLKDALDIYGRRGLKILDAGCGTGKNASVLKPFASVLDGVDLSEKMIGLAKARGLYRRLTVGDLTDFLKSGEKYDLIVLADVVCYFGDLKNLFAAAFSALATEGAVFLTVEKGGAAGYDLQPSGRYAHNRAYVAGEIEKAGGVVESVSQRALRDEGDEKIDGWVFFARGTVKNNENEN